jgi:hypothetical protein
LAGKNCYNTGMVDSNVELAAARFNLEVEPRNDGQWQGRDLREVAEDKAQRLVGATTENRIWNWLRTFPDADLELGVKVLDELRFIDWSEMRATMTRRLSEVMEEFPEGNLLLMAPVRRGFVSSPDSSATIINSWWQAELKQAGWEPAQEFTREGEKRVFPAGIYHKKGRTIIVTDTYSGWDRQKAADLDVDRFAGVAVYDDWSLSGTQSQKARSALRGLRAAGMIDDTTEFSLAFGYMTASALERDLEFMEAETGKVPKVLGREKAGFMVKTIDQILPRHERDRLDQLGRYGGFIGELNNLLTLSAISVPDNLHNAVKGGVALAFGEVGYSLVLDPRSNEKRGMKY